MGNNTIGGHSISTIHRYVLDSDKYVEGIREVAKNIRLAQKDSRDLKLVQQELEKSTKGVAEETKGLARSESKASQASRRMTKRTRDQVSAMKRLHHSYIDYSTAVKDFVHVAASATRGFDSMMERGFKFNNVMRNAPFSIDAAASATGGFVDRMTLAQTASRSAALGLKLNSKSFAALAKSATIAAKRMGTDIPSAINDVVLGMARMSPKILDNLGIVIRAKDAYKAWAKAHHTTTKGMTAVQKQSAFTEVAMKKLNAIARDGKLDLESNAAGWKQMKVQMDNSYTSMVAVLAKGPALKKFFKDLGNAMEGFALWASGSDLKKARIERSHLIIERSELLQKLHELQSHQSSRFLDEEHRLAKRIAEIHEELAKKTAFIDRKRAEEFVKSKGKGIGDAPVKAYTGATKRVVEKDVLPSLGGSRSPRGMPSWMKRANAQMADADIEADRQTNVIILEAYKKGKEALKRQKARIDEDAAATSARSAVDEFQSEQSKKLAKLREELAKIEAGKFASFRGELEGSAGFSVLKRMFPPEDFERIERGLYNLKNQSEVAFVGMNDLFSMSGAALGGLSDALFDVVSANKSAGDAFRDAFAAWAKSAGKMFMMDGLKFMILGGIHMFTPGMQALAGAELGGGAALVALGAGLGAVGGAAAKKPASTPAKRGGVDRGIASGGGRGGESRSVNVTYNVNTIVPPDPDAAAMTVGGIMRRASALGYA